MENQSQYDPSRKTVGAIYRDAQMSSHDKYVTNGDLTNELQSSLVEDLNETIQSNPYQDRAFYITVHEKKDKQMPRMILRRILTSVYRPFPEDDTLVFWTDGKSVTKFCWCLPHWSEMPNVLHNPTLFKPEYVEDIKQFKAENYRHFGFTKNDQGHWIADIKHSDKKMESRLFVPEPCIS